MKIKRLLIILGTLYSIGNVNAQLFMDVNTPSAYLVMTTEQQKIYLERFLAANPEIVKQCQAGWSLDKSNDYFIKWVADNPQFLRRNLTSAFTAALFSSCNLAK
jgi:hypothetical protein